MYHSYFGIEEQAFSIAVNPRYMYMSAQHREALAHLLYGVNSGGFVMLTGEVGTGKTTTIRCLLEQLPANADVAMILNPAASARDLMCSICDEFGVAYDVDETSTKVLTDKLYAFLLDNHSNGRNSIVLIDEAQLLRISTLEQIRLLTNLESNTQKMLQIILVGQPELNELLAKPALRQLSQRITARYHLRPLNARETGAYIRHRLSIAGMPPGRDPFPAPVVKKVHAITGGIPRLINILCDRMLLGAYTQEATMVNGAIYKQATEEVLGDPREKAFRTHRSLSSPLIYGGSAIIVALIISFALWLILTREPTAGAEAASDAVIPETPVVVEPQDLPAEDVAMRSQDDALSHLLLYLGIEKNMTAYPCWAVQKKGFHCETLEAKTWQDFLDINRPAVLTLNTPSRHAAYVTLVAINNNDATVLHDSQQTTISLDDIGTLWTGEYVLVWQKPEGFDGYLGLASTDFGAQGLASKELSFKEIVSKGPMVKWLAEQFATLDDQERPLAENEFNTKLERRVTLFQRQQNLVDNGIVDLKTLLRLNEALGLEQALQKDLSQWRGPVPVHKANTPQVQRN